ncbi:MAG: bifunctional proline dehydrogenase/L-glutamate gamma-semialdehyde dehydrogenase, partial [Sphingomonadales bacterium]|nr:bifunctional proline dehydrogenase/L-glutamate gamma-semialdehyde dehydrogenase [Sphingomonadales bacterium]
MEAHTETEHRSAASLAELRTQIRALALADEAVVVGQLLDDAPLTRDACKRVSAVAARLIAGSRKRKQERGTLDVFLQEFGLSNQEGIALMCLAEALLRIPDEDTADALIAEKIGSGKWEEHVGHSDSMFVNASTWALMLTGRVVELEKSVSGDLAGWV